MPIPTEGINKDTKDFDLLPLRTMAETMCKESIKAASCVKKALPAITKAITLVENAYKSGNKIIFAGAGTPGRLGILEAVECPPTFNVPYTLFNGLIAGGNDAVFRSKEGAEDDDKQGALDCKKIAKKGDVVISITSSGTTPYALGALKEGKKLKCKTVLIACNPNADKKNCDVFIYLPSGAEVITGSTRLKAGTAQKLALNMITTISMARCGKVYKNYMIDVQAGNNKLKKRATNLISIAAEIPLKEAEKLAKKTNYAVKTAVVMAKKHCSQKEAENILKKHKGFLRPSLNAK